MNLSIFNFKKRKKEKSAKAFLKSFGWFFASLFVVILGFILIIDPFGNMPFSPKWQRAPMAFNQRFSYPLLARSGKFDSVIIGTSATRHLRPELLNGKLGAKFTNLSMNAATPYEQYKIAALFFRHHKSAKYMIFGVDARPLIWCEAGEGQSKYTFRDFPEWMYDENKWNDLLYIMNGKNLEIASEQLRFLLGLMPSRYGDDGFAQLMARDEYSLAKARQHIYGRPQHLEKAPPLGKPALNGKQVKELQFPALFYIDAIMKAAPQNTGKIIFFPPWHWYSQPVVNSALDQQVRECKKRIVEKLKKYKNVKVVDFMTESEFTKNDENYLDDIHVTLDAGDRLARILADKIRK